MPELPPEIITSVLEEAYSPQDLTLRTCSLVNSTWNHSAQTLLFKSVILNDKFAQVFLQETLGGQRLALLQHVRVLEIPASGFTSVPDGLGSYLVTVLRLCAALYELIISFPGPLAFPPEIISDLHEINNQSRAQPLRSLRIRDCGVQSIQLYQLVSAFPTLEFLSVGSEIGRLPPKGYTCNARLYEIRLSRNLPNELLSWLLQSSQGHLQILELRDVPGRKMKTIFEPHCPFIRSLRLMPFNHISVDILKMCTNLEELVLMNIPYIFPLPRLPPSFRHMSVYILTAGQRGTLTPIIEVVKAHPNMQSLRCNPIAKTFLNFIELAQACKTHNVFLEVDAMEKWPIDHCVKTRVFPRRQSVSNFHLMN